MWPTWLVGFPKPSNVLFRTTEKKTSHYHWPAGAPEAPDKRFSKLRHRSFIFYFFVSGCVCQYVLFPTQRARHGKLLVPLGSVFGARISVWKVGCVPENRLALKRHIGTIWFLLH